MSVPVRYFLGNPRLAPLLDRAGEQRLFTDLAAAIDPEEKSRIRGLIASANLRMVISIANKFTRASNLTVEDLVGEGVIGLYTAIEKFDYTKGFKFSTYATWWIDRFIRDAIAENGRPLRLPRSASADLLTVVEARRRLRVQFGRWPSIAEIAAAAKVSEGQARVLLNLNLGMRSLDAPIDSDQSESFTLADMLADERHDDDPDPADVVALRAAVSALPERLQRLLDYDARGWPVDLIADKLAVSERFVYDLRAQAYDLLRAQLRGCVEVA